MSLTAIEYPNALEKALLDWGSDGYWFTTTSGTEAFTLSYGNLSVVAGESDGRSLPGSLPCCWRELAEELVDKVPETGECESVYVVFDGSHFGAFHFDHVSASGFAPRYYDPPGAGGVISSAKTLGLRKAISKTYSGKTLSLKSILPETYSDILRPELLRELEMTYKLSGGKWYLLPSDCFCCT